MADVFREVDEALREDRAKAYWQRYGRAVMAVAVLLVVGTAATVGWRNWQQGRMQAASAELTAAIDATRTSPQEAIAALGSIAQSTGGGHATIARLYEAGLLAGEGDRAGAARVYRAVAGDAGAEPVWRDLARLLAVLSDLDTGDPATLTAELAPLAADTSPWRYTARELTGLIAMRSGDAARARELFEGLAAAAEAPAGVRSRAGDLLRDLDG